MPREMGLWWWRGTQWSARDRHSSERFAGRPYGAEGNGLRTEKSSRMAVEEHSPAKPRTQQAGGSRQRGLARDEERGTLKPLNTSGGGALAFSFSSSKSGGHPKFRFWTGSLGTARFVPLVDGGGMYAGRSLVSLSWFWAAVTRVL